MPTMTLISRLILGAVSLVTLYVSLKQELQAVAVAALVALSLALLPAVFNQLIQRLRKFGPAEFDPIDEALKTLPEGKRAEAEAKARKRIERLEKAMGITTEFAGVVAAELAGLGIRVTALEEEVAALRSRVPPK